MKDYVDNPFQSPVILSLCTGMRGLERGLERVLGSITVAAYVEIESFIIYNLVRQMEQGVVDAAPVWTDVKTFPSQAFHGKIHGIIGGYPCQPFSTAGKREGENDERHLWPDIERIIQTVRPLWCFFENVDDHLTLGFDSVYKSLRNMGYRVEGGIYSAAEVGAPHKRERLFILAMGNTNINQPGKGRRNIAEMLGIPEEQWSKLSAPISGRAGDKLADANSDRWPANGNPQAAGENGAEGWQKRIAELGALRTSDPAGGLPENKTGDSELADSNSKGLERRIHGEIDDQEGWKEPGNGQLGSSGGNSKAMANTNNNGSGENCKQSELWPSGVEQSPSNSGRTNESENNEGGFDRWPLGAGPWQYEWEEPRTIKPGVGCTVNGYNFRIDLLRMYGNGVVEQTAAVAFIDLMKKHLKNSLKD